MHRWSGRVALVTGASEGIGEAISRLLVKHDMKVVGCARNLDKLKAIDGELKKEEGGSFFPIQCDLTQRDQIYAMFEKIKTHHGGVDVCINNAGMAYPSSLLDGTPEEWQKSLDLNVIALCLCTKLSVQQMKERGVDDGHIILLNSMGGHRLIQGSNYLHFYAGTKHMVKALTEGYRDELRQKNSKIRVSALSPGLVESEFVVRLFGDDPDKGRKVLQTTPCLKREDVAELVVMVMQQPPNVQIHDILVRDTDQVK
ncbi:dehydrogenase/reductase SDR family member 11 [Strongylocentrotus purpuratus]|uniref:Dehydrogenase/reductase SDR family member 11 n=1 Tax=Strongylocentrotus purpuratus TaxID=7668 RepID=A0A7M7TG71_STRPU|nr:dehydrogenase/reductase SDR family member 11 [Strongylocentrotus purpuratus]|eukprot:XP_780227.1 PREDICTED: dehydrogenase/reductase SDR family member 11 [Strongylocentrotus purpuratus]